ncbi:MAG: hypothetical protein E5Y79_05365 [Mesorhizobium sp.]|nr:hypothetical protein [Mesorhizobium sp.]TIL61409.1 MAG: hypothetical protein E5Y79_05365 [Mesorhizobium sp.]TIL94502.1 MAG: hypothetical protein E5Y73_11315 [Mesorhizobium sp.]
MKAYRREKGLAKRKGGIGSELALVVAQIGPERRQASEKKFLRDRTDVLAGKKENQSLREGDG